MVLDSSTERRIIGCALAHPITPASAAAVRGANFATAKFRDAYGSPLEAIVREILVFLPARLFFYLHKASSYQ